jgi:ABC-type lipoprotein release transport system permease subunit
LTYSLGSVLRHGRRSLYTIIGIAIALSLISGSWIAIDSSGLGLLRAALDGVPVDYAGNSVNASMLTITADAANITGSTVKSIETVNYVEAASGIISVRSPMYMNDSGGFYTDQTNQSVNGSLVFLSSTNKHLLSSFKIEGALPEPGTASIPKDVADALHIKVGDNITCVFKNVFNRMFKNGTSIVIITYYNVTSRVSSIWTQPGFEDTTKAGFGTPVADKGDGDVWLGLANDPVVFNLQDYVRFGANSSLPDSAFSIDWSYFIWVNRGEVIRLANIQSTIDLLGSIGKKLAMRLDPLGISTSASYLIVPLQKLDVNLQSEEPLLLALSVPVLALGTYLSVVSIDLSVTERRREAGILKSRGSTDRQVFNSLIVEATALGTISGVAGLLLGALVSRFLLSTFASLGGEATTEITDLLASPATIILCVLFGIALMLLSSYGPFKRVSRTSVSEALHHYSPSAIQLDYLAGADIILVVLSVWSIVSVVLGIDWAGKQGFPWIAEVLMQSLVLLGYGLLPLLPFIMSLSLVRLLTRGSRRLYSKFTWLVKPWTKNLHYLVERNIVRNPRRASNLCMVISLALAFGLFISITTESTMNYEREQVRFDVGSDIKLDTSYPGPTVLYVVNVSDLDAIGSLPGVEHYVSYSHMTLLFDISGYLYSASSIEMNTTGYRETVRPSDFYFGSGGSQLLDKLSVGSTVLISKDFSEQTGIQVGDRLPVVVESYSSYNRINVTVAGLMKGLPGLPGSDALIDRHTLSSVSAENISGAFDKNGAFIEVTPGTDPHQVADAAVSMYQSLNLTSTSTVLQDGLDALNKNPTYESLAVFLYMEYTLSVVIMTIGVGLLIFVAVHDREKELACIMARGASAGQIRRVLMGESMSLMALGLVVGTAIGIVTAYMFNALSGEVLYTSVERKMIFTYVSFFIVLSSVVALLAASLLATARAGKIRLAEVLRIRGG